MSTQNESIMGLLNAMILHNYMTDPNQMLQDITTTFEK